jgi:hypothetical protein
MKITTRELTEYHFGKSDIKRLHEFGDMFSDQAETPEDTTAVNLFRSMNRVFEKYEINRMLLWLERLEKSFETRIENLKNLLTETAKEGVERVPDSYLQHQIDNVSVWLSKIKDVRHLLTTEDTDEDR